MFTGATNAYTRHESKSIAADREFNPALAD